MTRSPSLVRALWSIAATGALASCGRLGFDESGPLAAIEAAPVMSSVCGAASAGSTEVAITNEGDADLVIRDATATGGFTVMSVLPLTVAPGDSATLALVPPAAVIGTDRGGTVKTGMLTVTTNESTNPAHHLELASAVVGANFEFTDVNAMPVTLTFSADGVCPTPQTVYLTNLGNADADVSSGSSMDFRLMGFGGGTIGQGASGAVTVHVVTGGACARNGFVNYAVTGTVCTSTPAVLQASFNITGASSCACS